MKRIDHMQNSVPAFSRLRSLTELPADRDKASSGKLSSSSTMRTKLLVRSYPNDFLRLFLELFARSVMNSETVLPKAVETAGLIMPRLSLGFASDASLRRYLWKGEW
jgi:hypothetical protein